ncbi:olfactory receptor 5AR1-like [Apteryx mantelli]|uniref:Olfactory receptor n=1 Tax=Apteryx mantelli TaxID=2696672 RepID=A0ABM4EFK2_9AVES
MVKGNLTGVSEFTLQGFTDNPQLQAFLFVLLLLIYTVSLLGNLTIITLIRIEPRLHIPMCFFICNLSFVDITYSSVIAPKTMVNLLAEKKVISFAGCVTQFFLHSFSINAEVLLLAVMAYDRFISVCEPLRYAVLISRKLCVQLVSASYLCSCINAVAHTASLFSLSFCGSNVINHFFCDIPPLQKLSCSDTCFAHMVHVVFSAVAGLSTVLAILISYLYIIMSILRIRCARDRWKTFSTCASHLSSVTLFYGSLFFIYLRPMSSSSADQYKVVSVFYTLIVPMLNPLIYSLRNKEMKDALRRTIAKTIITK